jgi:enoyl-CoA hydratase/carnithine racemase
MPDERDGIMNIAPDGFLASVDEYTQIRFEVDDDGIGVLTLARPEKLNAFDKEMLAEIRDVIWRATFNDDIRGLVITGAGRGFCAGRDIAGLQFENGLSTPQYRAYVRANHEAFDDLESLEKPVIAAVNGVCAGGGVELAVACDIRIAAEGATFLLPETQLGVIPASGACSRMIQIIGIGRLKEMIMTGDPIDAAESYRIGLANHVTTAEKLLETAKQLLRRTFRRAPQAVGMAKHVVNACQNVDMETGRLLERLGQSVLIRTDDAQEGMAAFLAKADMRFEGR